MDDALEEYWAEVRPRAVETKTPSLTQALQEEVAQRNHLVEVMIGVPPRSDEVDSLRDYVNRDPEQSGSPIQVGIGLSGGLDLGSIDISAGSYYYQADDTINLLQREIQILTANATMYSMTINTLSEVVRSLQVRVQELEVQVNLAISISKDSHE